VLGGGAGQASGNVFVGISIQLGASGISKLVREHSGVRNTQYVSLKVIASGFTWTSTLYSETHSQTISTDYYIPYLIDNGNTLKSYIRDSSTGVNVPLTGSNGIQKQATGSMSSAAAITPDEYSWYFPVSGTTTIDNITNAAAWTGRHIVLKTAASLTITHNAGGTGNIRCSGSANLSMTANDVVQFVSDGTLWWQAAPVVVI
jgi:hypothetical protein